MGKRVYKRICITLPLAGSGLTDPPEVVQPPLEVRATCQVSENLGNSRWNHELKNAASAPSLSVTLWHKSNMPATFKKAPQAFTHQGCLFVCASSGKINIPSHHPMRCVAWTACASSRAGTNKWRDQNDIPKVMGQCKLLLSVFINVAQHYGAWGSPPEPCEKQQNAN